MSIRSVSFAAVLALAVAGCSQQAPAPDANLTTQIDQGGSANDTVPSLLDDNGSATDNATGADVAAAAPAAFAQCRACHTAAKDGPNLIGPNLYGVAGQPAGKHAGYSYSTALTGAGLTWDDATLDKWLENPRQLVPGTKMSFAGLSDEAKRQEVIAYLKTLKD